MREIKFRVWDYSHQEMVNSVSIIHCDLLNKTDLRYYVDRTYTLVRADNIGVELMQFTGIRDKNDKEIYEGDIVSFCSGGDYVGVIGFKNAMFVVNWKQPCYIRKDLGGLVGVEDHMEVIGNIYENSELLEVKND